MRRAATAPPVAPGGPTTPWAWATRVHLSIPRPWPATRGADYKTDSITWSVTSDVTLVSFSHWLLTYGDHCDPPLAECCNFCSTMKINQGRVSL